MRDPNIWKWQLDSTAVGTNFNPCDGNSNPCDRNFIPCDRNFNPCDRNFNPCYRNFNPCNSNFRRTSSGYQDSHGRTSIQNERRLLYPFNRGPDSRLLNRTNFNS
ncbi:unnamed protein product [Psylliodes chrysocephalus]|uniref:Uncharacterized protein n=1 Tax=Psylliodes chrysocephalus TaxID=3402493 RepID=A0A9P0CDM3_9CUCU|nr:unnamed protein product [Psylliodes chrysocephala]